ncbi:MAG: peptidoglycan DD-metalloendopeptidase family protein [Alphaproteobacteria bacterium]|nr:peptidoglycan DD-metalloendopeptidase family protein [Alphaproteobacteria bacterium]
MFSFITRNFSSLASLLTAPFRAFWRLVRHIFPAQDITAISDGGNLSYYRMETWYRFGKFCAKVGLVIWAAWSSYVFVYHRPMLDRRTRQLNECRIQHAQQMSDLTVFFKAYSDLHKEMNTIDDQLANSTRLSKADRDKLLTRRVTTWAQIEMLATRLNTMFNDADYAPEFVRYSDLAVDYEITREENNLLRTQNKALEDGMIAIGDANTQIIERVSKLTKENTDVLSRELRKINNTLTSLGLSEKLLAARALQTSNIVVGAAVQPMAFNPNTDPKYLELAEKIELWHGLSRAHSMLPLGAPVTNPRITSPFGKREDPIDGGPGVHRGIDFAGSVGTPLLAVAPGRVTFVGERSGYGKTVEIDHGLGFTTLYAHLSKISVDRGDIVKSRQIIGLGGNSGRSTGPHLHYEIRYNDNPFNPYGFVKGGQ